MVIDLVVGAVMLISAIISFFRGFIREALTIAGVVAGFFAAVFFGPKLSPVFYNWLGVDTEAEEIEKLFDIVPMNIVADVCAYAAIFVFVVILVAVISHFTSGAVKAMGLGPIDRTIGVIFGIIRALLLLSLLYLPFHLLMDEESKTEYFGNSKTHYYIEKTASYIATFFPQSDEAEETAEEVVDETIKSKLLENNFLKDKNLKLPIKSNKTENAEIGYKSDQREGLEDLFDRPTINQ